MLRNPALVFSMEDSPEGGISEAIVLEEAQYLSPLAWEHINAATVDETIIL